MLTSLAYIFLAGLAAAAVCRFVKLPRIIGMLTVGVILGPHVLNVIDKSILGVSADLRQMALIIILIKAGLSLNLADLKKVGRPALLMSFLPAVFEIAAFVLFAPYVLGVTMLEAAIMGAVLGAVSPAVVVPKMVSLIEKGLGNDKKIPQLILAGAFLDDVFVIVLFSSFVGMAKGKGASAGDFINIPVSVFTGVLLGAALGFVLALFFEKAYSHGNYVRNSTKVLVILGIAFLLNGCEDMLKGWIALSGLLSVMSMACVLKTKLESKVSKRISEKIGKLWIGAEVVLFVLVGAAVDIRYTLKAGPCGNRHDLFGARFPFDWRAFVPCRNKIERKGKIVLRYFLSSQSHSSGGNRFRSSYPRTSLRKLGFVDSCFSDTCHGAFRRYRHGSYV